MDNEFMLSNAAKKEYLNSVIGKIYKVLHLIEEEATTGYSPKAFIASQLWEINAANELFDGKLVNIIVKLKGVYDTYQEIEFADCKKQIFEIKKIINSLLKSLEG